jgi:RecA/RadA recombinase
MGRPPKKSPKSAAKKGKSAAKKVRVKLSPLAEYQQTVKDQGIAVISTLAQDECVTNIPGRISTGSLALDRMLTNAGEPADWAGYPLSRVIELYGPPHIGKSTLMDQAFGSVQRLGGVGVLLDTETSRDRHYVGRLQCDITKLQYVEFAPADTSVENVLRVVNTTIDYWRNNHPDTPVLIGWDALGGTATEDEIDRGLVGEKHTKPGAAAKAMALAARLTTPRLKASKIAFMIANHEYQNINTGPFAGKKSETYGGQGTRHMASLRIQLYNAGEYIKTAEGVVLGRQIVAKLVKNRLGATVEVILPMLTGWGTDNVWTLYEDLTKAGIITTGGGWSALNLDGSAMKFQGWLGLRKAIDADPSLYLRLVSVWKTIER